MVIIAYLIKTYLIIQLVRRQQRNKSHSQIIQLIIVPNIIILLGSSRTQLTTELAKEIWLRFGDWLRSLNEPNRRWRWIRDLFLRRIGTTNISLTQQRLSHWNGNFNTFHLSLLGLFGSSETLLILQLNLIQIDWPRDNLDASINRRMGYIPLDIVSLGPIGDPHWIVVRCISHELIWGRIILSVVAMVETGAVVKSVRQCFIQAVVVVLLENSQRLLQVTLYLANLLIACHQRWVIAVNNNKKKTITKYFTECFPFYQLHYRINC